MRLNQQLHQQQKQVQKLAMTQELQQSIQMLQFSGEELFLFLENKALENPLIEVQIAEDYLDAPRPAKQYQASSEELNFLNQIPDTHSSLFESLLEQIYLNYRDTYLRQLVLFLVEQIDVNGYLTITLEGACQRTGASMVAMLDALTLLQQLDPAGVGARDLQECLLLQIERDPVAPNLAYIVIEDDFEEFAMRKWERIGKKYAISLQEIQGIQDYIQTLSPFPGAAFGSEPDLYIIPDLYVEVTDGQVRITSNKKSTPKIEFQAHYFKRMEQLGDQETKEYLKEKKEEFNWIKRSLAQRGDTILKVGVALVEKQQAFFTKESHPLHALTLKEIADELGIHESTVSRAVNGKYLQTTFGTFELRSFFTTAISQPDGTSISADAAKKELAELVAHEDKKKPFSDQKLVTLLTEKGVEISRRTVAKYRESLGIPASSKRKRF